MNGDEHVWGFRKVHVLKCFGSCAPLIFKRNEWKLFPLVKISQGASRKSCFQFWISSINKRKKKRDSNLFQKRVNRGYRGQILGLLFHLISFTEQIRSRIKRNLPRSASCSLNFNVAQCPPGISIVKFNVEKSVNGRQK